MADWTKATLAARILESLGVVGEAQSPTDQQQNRTEEAIDSVYKRLRPKGLVPFPTSAIPEWAQYPLMHVVAFEVAPTYGYAGARLSERAQLAQGGMRKLADGVAANPPPVPVTARYY